MRLHQVPKECPECGASFGLISRSYCRLQWKAHILIWLSILLVIPWGIVVFVGCEEMVQGLANTLRKPIPVPIVLYVVPFFVTALLPYLAAVAALRMRRKLKIGCPDCDWKKSYMIDQLR